MPQLSLHNRTATNIYSHILNRRQDSRGYR